MVLPPSYKRGAGWPKKLKKREIDEGADHSKLRRINTVNKCRRCHEHGHNIRTCKIPPPPKPRIESNVEGEEPEKRDQQTLEQDDGKNNVDPIPDLAIT